MSFLEVTRGQSPLVLGLPHTGTDVPPDVADGLNETGRELADTDWHIQALYAGLVGDASTVRTTIHRYVIDVNRDPEGASLYPGQNTTSLCPVTDFDGQPIWKEGAAPDAAEIARRREAYHAPYHAALAAELERVRDIHGFAVLYDCHSIRSEIPFLFDGTLPDFNVGTDEGRTCAPSIQDSVHRRCEAAKGYSAILNGRFKGGWTTRHYGRPGEGLHAIQMELAQCTYMHESPPWDYAPDRADRLRPHLKTILDDLIRWRPE
ncbi:N-formylglutamate deformylase [Roseovarius atlanticus]|uniref:N-formylglutamate deformylase n=1 Tax=Roseovarius atlanticus TaxID=1641875 RepID=UPI0009EC69EF|nr:N-formylglutamate deformylase [Roseovarius atlanticus]